MVKSAHVIFVSNPFEPFKDTAHHEIKFSKRRKSVSVRRWLKANRIPKFTRPTICLFNGEPLLRKSWGKHIRPGDTVNFVAVAGGDPVTWLWIVSIALAVTAVAIALTVKIPSNLTGDSPTADPTYSLKGQRNQIRLGEPIEVPYGKVRQWPSYCAQPYNQYKDNKQWLYQLFCLGQGTCTIHSINIEDTPIANFQNVQYEVIPPGSPVTLFPANVVTSVEISGIELLGTNEGGLDGTDIEDSEGDVGEGIDPTDHPAFLTAGPFVLNPSGTQTNRVEVDVQLPRGLYTQANDGTFANRSVSAVFEIQQIDNTGSPLGFWSTPSGFNWSITSKDTTPQRFTLGADVTPGRYRIRATRTNAKDTDAKSGNTLIWEAARAFIPDTTVDDGVTKLAVAAQASNNLNDNSAQKINVVATWHRPVWDGTTWTMQETRSPVWAFCDAFRAQYGARLADAYLNLPALLALSLVYADRAETFDWIFEQRATVWDVARQIAAVGRAVPMLEGSRITAIRDGVKTFPVAVFNQENIVADSFRQEIKLAELNPNDGLLITYTDPDSWKEATVLCCLDDEQGDNPETRKIPGITDRAQAYRLGMYLRAYDRYVRENFVWSTGLEGHIPSFGDMIAAAHDVPNWNSGGIVLAGVGAPPSPNIVATLTLSDSVGTIDVNSRMLFRKRDGSVMATKTPSAGADSKHVIVVFTPAEWAEFNFDGIEEPPLYLFGNTTTVGKNVIVTSLAGSDTDEVEVQGRPYDGRLFDFEDADPPAAGETHGHLPDKDALPEVSGLRVTPSPTNTIDGGVGVAASWFAMSGAMRYRVEYSYDAQNWNLVTETQDLTVSFEVANRYLYVRVAALNTAQGEWAYWTGQAPITDVTVCQEPGAPVLTSGAWVLIQPDGTAVPRLRLDWTLPPDELVKAQGFIRIQFKIWTDSDWTDWGTVQGSQTFDFITDVKIGLTYDVRIRAENKFGGVSAWVDPMAGAHTVQGDTTAPNAATGLSVTAYPGFNEIRWTASTSPDVFEYRIYRNTVNSMSGAVLLGENSGTFFDDAATTPGVTYYYFVAPVDSSENEGTATAAGSATALASLGDVAPSNPSAATLNSSGTYLAGDGQVFAYFEFFVPALPAGARWQNLLYRRNVSGDYMVAAQLKNTGTTLIRIDDLSPGVSYQVATQAWSSSQGSSVIAATGSPFTAPNDPTIPGTPTGLAVVAGTGKAVSLDWNDNTEADFSEYGVYRSTDNVSFSKIAEVRASRFVDTEVTLGTTYYYKVSAYDKTENQSALSASVSVTPVAIPPGTVDSTTAPSNPSAPTLNTSSFYTATDGSIYSRLLINVPAMPSGAVILNVLYRRNGQAGWIVGDQRSAGGGTSSIDDLTPGESYEIACQAFNVFGVGSSVITATGSPFTAPSKSSGPGSCSGIVYTAGNSSTYNGPVTTNFNTVFNINFSTKITFTPPSDKDVAYFEYAVTSTDSNFAADVATHFRTNEPIVFNHMSPPSTLYFRVRAVNTSGQAGSWAGGGTSLASVCGVPSGNMLAQSDSNVSVSAIKTGASGASSIRQVRTIYDENNVVTLTGGSPTENVAVSLSNRGFSAQPDVGTVQVVDPPGDLEVYYNWSHGSNSSSTAILQFKTSSGAAIGGGPRRYHLRLVEYV